MNDKKTIHLYNRFGFGLTAKELKKYSEISFKKQLKKEKATLINIDFSDIKVEELHTLKPEERMAVRKILRQKRLELGQRWIEQMIASKNIIHEKMVLFWHHHFACIIPNGRFAQQFSNIIRSHALGNFGDLLLEVSQSAAMISFLHTRQNRKRHPNEDFARELCELYTLGRDNEYTEQDIKEIARCFTGWGHNFKGEFNINTRQHDKGKKTIFEEVGNFDGQEVIQLILKKKACARFICKNIYQYFVHPKSNAQHIEELTEVFYASGYDIQHLLIYISSSDWFYADKNILARIKSPIEFIVGLARQFKISSPDGKGWQIVQRILGQELYLPPNVKGWKVDREWINSNSLPMRMALPSFILTNAILDITPKPDYDSNPNDGAMMMERNKFSKRLNFDYDWNFFFRENKNIDLLTLFFNGKISPQLMSFLKGRSFDSKKEKVIQLISLPEYQLA